MLPRPLLAMLLVVLSTSLTLGQSGPQVYTLMPTGASPGSTVEVTVAGANLQDAQSLLFSNSKIKAELVGDTAVAESPKTKTQGGGKKMATTKASAALKFKVTVPADVATGAFDLRVVTKAGLSNPRTFTISKTTEVAEKEPNNDLPQAQAIALETSVSGEISAPTDVDYVKFPVKAGQTVVVACLTSAIDSKLPADLTVATVDGRPLASNRGYRGGDAVVQFTAPSDGEYVARVASFAYVTGGPDHFYRLTVTTKPWVDAVYPPLWLTDAKALTAYGKNLPGAKPDTAVASSGQPALAMPLNFPGKPTAKVDELRTGLVVAPSGGFVDAESLAIPALDLASPAPLVLFPQGKVTVESGDNDSPEKAIAVTVPGDIAGRIEKRNDRDWCSFPAKKGEPVMLELFAERIGSQIDAYFLVTDDKGKVLAEVDEAADTLSPNQFYTRSEDPVRYRFLPPADGTYRVMVSTREAAIQSGVRDVYVLRMTPETPDFRVAVMPFLLNYPEGVTVPRGGSYALTVYVDRRDGFDGAVSLSVKDLPAGVTCPPQVVGPQQSRTHLVLTAAKDAKDWSGFLTVLGTAEIKGAKVEHAARQFTVTWSLPEQQGRAPNFPMLTRLDRGPGLALAVRGETSFTLTPTTTAPIKVKAGDKAEVTLKLTRPADLKDAVQVITITTLSPLRGGSAAANRAEPVLATINADKSDTKVSFDVPPTTAPGTYTLVFRALVPDPASKQNQLKPPKAACLSSPVTIEVQAKETPKAKK